MKTTILKYVYAFRKTNINNKITTNRQSNATGSKSGFYLLLFLTFSEGTVFIANEYIRGAMIIKSYGVTKWKVL